MYVFKSLSIVSLKQLTQQHPLHLTSDMSQAQQMDIDMPVMPILPILVRASKMKAIAAIKKAAEIELQTEFEVVKEKKVKKIVKTKEKEALENKRKEREANKKQKEAQKYIKDLAKKEEREFKKKQKEAQKYIKDLAKKEESDRKKAIRDKLVDDTFLNVMNEPIEKIYDIIRSYHGMDFCNDFECYCDYYGFVFPRYKEWIGGEMLSNLISRVEQAMKAKQDTVELISLTNAFTSLMT